MFDTIPRMEDFNNLLYQTLKSDLVFKSDLLVLNRINCYSHFDFEDTVYIFAQLNIM